MNLRNVQGLGVTHKMPRRDSSSSYSSRSRSRSISSRSSRSRSRSRGRSPYSRRRRSISYSSYSSRSYSSRSYSSYSSSSSDSHKVMEKPFWACVTPITSNVSVDHLKEIFSMFGKVRKVQLNKNYGRFIDGYVEMESQKDLDEVISGLSGGSIDGFTISVKPAEEPMVVSEKVKDSFYQQSKGNYSRYSRSPIRERRRRSPPGKSTRRYSRSPPPRRNTRRYSRSPRRSSRSPLRYSRSPVSRRYSRSPRRRNSRSLSPRFSRPPKTAARPENSRYRR